MIFKFNMNEPLEDWEVLNSVTATSLKILKIVTHLLKMKRNLFFYIFKTVEFEFSKLLKFKIL